MFLHLNSTEFIWTWFGNTQRLKLKKRKICCITNRAQWHRTGHPVKPSMFEKKDFGDKEPGGHSGRAPEMLLWRWNNHYSTDLTRCLEFKPDKIQDRGTGQATGCGKNWTEQSMNVSGDLKNGSTDRQPEPSKTWSCDRCLGASTKNWVK